MTDAAKYGERKHETCRFGTLNAAFILPLDGGAQRPSLMPICNWQAADPQPPALRRAWHGAVEYERDCAVCLAHEPVPATALREQG